MKILKIDNNTGEILDEYQSMQKASEDVGCSTSTIRGACFNCHRGALAKGYRWIALDPKTNRNNYGHKVNDKGENLSIEEINQLVFERRERIIATREEGFRNRPRTLKLVCNKCFNIGKLNSYTNIESLKNDGFVLTMNKNNEISINCLKCNTKIKVGEK